MGYLPSSKFGDCTQCPAKNTACVKVGKNLFCLPCHRANKNQSQVTKAKERDNERLKASMLNRSPKEKKQIKQSVRTSVRSLVSSEGNKEVMSKSKLLKLSDAAFSRYVIKRDTVKGKITCPCCGNEFDVLQVNNDGEKVVQNLHLVSRKVYSLRFDEDNAHAGDSYCNLQMHLFPDGKEYKNYREYLVNKIGETAVAEMEIAHRRINKLEETVLKNVIEFYSH